MIFTAAALSAGTVFAQDKSESVENVLNELTAYNGNAETAAMIAEILAEPAIPAVDVDAVPAVEEEAAPKSSGWHFWGKKAKVEEPAEESSDEVDVMALSDEEVPVANVADLAEITPDAPAGAQFAQEQQGLAEVVQLAPENLAARLYPTTLKERDHRTAEVSGMKAVDAAWSTALTLRSYALAEEAVDKMELTNVEGAINISSLFPQVDFPKGSSAIYQPKSKILYVRNTAENFDVLEAILDSMEVLKESAGGDQVEIEAKFVEVSEGTLEALGFQWDFDGAVDIGAGVSFDDGASGLFANSLRGSASGSSPDLPFSTSSGGPDGSTGATGDWSSFPMTDTFSTSPSTMTLSHSGANPLDLMISALDQSSGSDVLSAPRVVTKSGEEATIRVGELHYYPEVFEGDTDQATMLVVSYQDFTEKLLGVELSVTPEVDGSNITLALNPRITELAGWQNYQLAPANYIYNHRQATLYDNFTHDNPVVASLPIYKKREIETEVTISDGSTIGMGGLISETIESYEDKVPVLGSLPLIGRLFRNEGEQAVKRNLLMFVTASIVEPTGRINTSRSFE
jgi:type II secretory pathway component GspD/PulD (secretin)